MSLFRNFFSKSLSTQLTVTSNNGFHLRPIAQFASLAKSYSCQITASTHEQSADAKNVTTLLSLSLDKGDQFTLEAKGENAQEALNALDVLFKQLMHDDEVFKAVESTDTNYAGTFLQGEIISEGIALANTYRLKTEILQHKSDIGFKEAVQKALNEFETLQKNDTSGIYLAQKELLSALAKDHQTLETFEIQIAKASQELLGKKLETKRSDYSDILQRVKRHMGLEIKMMFPSDPFILLAEDLLPSQIDMLIETKVEGVILQETSLGGHTAILLRAAGIPSLIANIGTLLEEKNVILDTYAGVVVKDPSHQDIKHAKVLIENEQKSKESIDSRRFDSVVTKEGKHIQVFANITDVKSAKQAKEEGAEGVGLFRTEFLFKEEKPSFDMQVSAYKKVFETFENTTIRTLDVGGDKVLPYIHLDKEMNPFLGIRGIRLFTTHPQLMQEQLLAILTASQNKKIKIMFPMVSTVEEFIQAKTIAQEIAAQHNLDISNIQFGIMLEVPSVLFMLEIFNTVVDFYSIGTNDLTQYLFAMDRTHTSIMADPLSPAVFDAIKHIMEKTNKPVSICGELAANKKAIPTLVKLGVETLSVSGKNISQTKEEIRNA